jgi:hypothetical protein
MPISESYRVVIIDAPEGDRLPRKDERRVERARRGKAVIKASAAVKALEATAGGEQAIARIPSLATPRLWVPIASFTVCKKTGTATYLDIWDTDHFDGFTDMQRCLSDCRAWFSADGYTYWDSPQTKTGRVNCYFRAPTAGNYVCTAQLESFAGPAQVECLIDAFSYGPLPFSGAISQPHPATLGAGYHSFRIRQMSGSFFFVGLTVWRV